MISSQTVKEIMLSFGADLCGIASLDRFADAPKGFHPLDVFPACKSVISFGCRFPVGTLLCTSHTPYTRVRNSITPKMDAIALNFCIEMEKHGVMCVPIPTNESEWDKNTDRWRSIISQKHAAQAAGLGTIGRHSLLITPEFGSMVWLGAVLCSQELEADPLKEDICINCNLCVDACPVNALETPELKQQTCWDHAFGDDEETKSWRIACHKCRDACPYNLGSQNKGIIQKELINNWLSVFGADVDKTIMDEHVTADRNHLWHIFTWGNVTCLEGNDARNAFDRLQYQDAIRFCGGYSMKIENVSIIGNVTAKELDDDPESDIYIVAKDFSWTYVRTHESEWCGPYFCIKKQADNAKE